MCAKSQKYKTLLNRIGNNNTVKINSKTQIKNLGI